MLWNTLPIPAIYDMGTNTFKTIWNKYLKFDMNVRKSAGYLQSKWWRQIFAIYIICFQYVNKN